MDRFKIDYDALIQKIVPNTNKMPLLGNEHRLVRVAFDLFRLKDGDPDELWQVQSSDDGEFLVRTFSIPEEETITANDWSVETDKKEANLTISYKKVPITRIATKNYGVKTPEETMMLRSTLYKKLNTDKKFGMKLFASLPIEKQKYFKEAGILDWISSEDILKETREKIEDIIEEKEEKSEEEDNEDNEDEWKLAFLDLKLRKNSELDEEFEETWWDSGMEADEKKKSLEEANKILEESETEEYDDFMDIISKELGEEDYETLKMDACDTEQKAIPINLPADDPEDYSDYFMMKCKEHGINPNNIPDLSEEKRKVFFEDVDAGWKAQNECIDPLTQRHMLETGLGPVVKKKKSELLISKRSQEDPPFNVEEPMFEGESIGEKSVEEILQDIKDMSLEERNKLMEALKEI